MSTDIIATQSFEMYKSQDKYLDKKPTRYKSVIAGSLLILSGILAMLIFAVRPLMDVLLIFMIVTAFPGFCFYWLFAFTSIIGGVFCLFRRRHTFAVLCAVLNIFVNVFSGLVSIALLYWAEDEFKD